MPRWVRLACLLLLSAASLKAQVSHAWPSSLAPKSRIRLVMQSEPGVFLGTVLVIDGDSLFALEDLTRVRRSIALEDVWRLARALPPTRLGWKAVRRGAIGGAAFGALAGVAGYVASGGNLVQGVAADAVFSAIPGAAIGGIVGLLVKNERWEDITPSARPSVSFAPVAHRAAVALCLRF